MGIGNINYKFDGILLIFHTIFGTYCDGACSVKKICKELNLLPISYSRRGHGIKLNNLTFNTVGHMGDLELILDYIDIDVAIQKNVDNEDIIIIGENIKYIENEDPQTIFINEFGLYSLILVSKNDDGKKFRRWITLEVFPLIIKTDDNNLINNYIEEDLDKYYKKDCVYIIHIKDNIYKYGNTSHLFKRLQAHKTNLKYNKIIKIYEMNNMNESRHLENKIKKLVKTLNINIIYNNHIEIFQVNNNDLEQLIEKFDELSLTINNDLKFETSVIIEKERTKQLELENENLKLKLELLKFSK